MATPLISADLDKAIAPRYILQEVRSSQISVFLEWHFLQRSLVYIYTTISIRSWWSVYQWERASGRLCEYPTFLFQFTQTAVCAGPRQMFSTHKRR